MNFHSARAALLLLAVLTPACAASRPVEGPSPSLVTLRPDLLSGARARLAAGDSGLRPALDELISDAESALAQPPVSVMDKKRVPPSGDRHDYMSLGPYWWPDPDEPDGLPYIRRDGERNPETEDGYDRAGLRRVIGGATTLSLAYHFTGNEAYAEHAAILLRTWFLDPATRMNPNLEYAQAVPGSSTGRRYGIIETSGLPRVLDGIVLLRASPHWTADDDEAMREWAAAFLDWLRTSEHGRNEFATRNNHGSWYDVQIAALALFVDQRELAREIVASSAERRIAAHIEPDGRQPQELARTRSLSYSIFNLRALMQLAELGRAVGVDLWHYEAPNGGSIRKALDYLAPYADPAQEWPGQQITPVGAAEILIPLRLAEAAYGDSRYGVYAARIPGDAARVHIAQLLYPPPPPLAATAAAAQRASSDLVVRAENPLAIARSDETLGLRWALLGRNLRSLAPDRVRVVDAATGQELTSQVLDLDADGRPDSLLFQADFRPSEARSFVVQAAASSNEPDARVHARFDPAREDLAWESDRIAFRLYGRKLWELENLHSNGIDVWTKRTRSLVLNSWYEKNDYHTDTGEGADFFLVGRTLGAGGTGIWRDGKLWRGDNFLEHRILADGPIRVVFEVSYGPIDAGGLEAREVKRVSIDAGHNVFRQESTFRADASSFEVAVGLVKRPGLVGSTRTNGAWSWLTAWGPMDPRAHGHGDLGTAVLLERATHVAMTETDDHYLAVGAATAGQPFISYVGAGWTASRDFTGVEDWWAHIDAVAARLENPIRVTLWKDGQAVAVR